MTKYSAAFLDKHRDINVDHGSDWWDCIEDDFKEVCKILGIRLADREPCFSGFWSQGDGASWTGHYDALHWQKSTYDTAPVEIRKHAPKDETLHTIADELCLLARIYGPVSAKVSRTSARYVHSSTMQIDYWEHYHEVDDEDGDPIYPPMEICNHIENVLSVQFHALADWYYRALEKEYEYLTSDEAVAETLDANEIEEEREDEDADN